MSFHESSQGSRIGCNQGGSDQTGRGKMLLQSGDKNLFALCDIFTDVRYRTWFTSDLILTECMLHQVPVRRNALLSHAAARAELHRCRRIVAAMTLLAPHVAFSFGAYMHYETEQQILLQCDKVSGTHQNSAALQAHIPQGIIERTTI